MNYIEAIMAAAAAPHGRNFRGEPLGPPPPERPAGERSVERAAEIKYWADTDLDTWADTDLDTQAPFMVFKLLMMLREAVGDYDWIPKPEDPAEVEARVRKQVAAELLEIMRRHKNPGIQAGLLAAAEHLDPPTDDDDDEGGS